MYNEEYYNEIFNRKSGILVMKMIPTMKNPKKVCDDIKNGIITVNMN